jgi:hypothetical protein
MMTNDHRGARPLNATEGEIADAELNAISGGDKKTPTPKPTPKPEPYMVYTMHDVLVSSY